MKSSFTFVLFAFLLAGYLVFFRMYSIKEEIRPITNSTTSRNEIVEDGNLLDDFKDFIKLPFNVFE